MKYGNCLVCGLVLFFSEMKNSPQFLFRYRPQSKVPHFMVRSNSGLHHFKLVRDILPKPFNYLVFKGEFQTLDFDKEELFYKS